MTELSHVRGWHVANSRAVKRASTSWQVEHTHVDDSEIRIEPGRYLTVVSDQLLIALAKSDPDWRTVSSLANELGVSDLTIREAIAAAGGKVRHPVGAKGEERDWVRLASKGYTWQEHYRILKSYLSRRPLR
jgi:hypothetical protein